MDQDILNNLTPEETEVCSKCGSPDIELRMWVNINTNEVSSCCDDGDTFCNSCEEIIDNLTTMAKFDEENGSIGRLLFPEEGNKITAQKFHDADETKNAEMRSGLDRFKSIIETGKAPE